MRGSVHGDELEFNGETNHLLNPLSDLQGPLLGLFQISALADISARGQAIFEGPLRIQGMTPTVQAMANVVVAQRLGQQMRG